MPFDPTTAVPETIEAGFNFDPSTAKPATTVGEFGRGVSSGLDTLQASGYGLIGQIGAATGLRPMQEFGERGFKRNVQEAARSAPAISDIADVSSFRDAALYGSGGLGQLTPFAASSIVSGGVGRSLGRVAGRALGAAETGADLGMKAGLAANSIGTESGLIYGDIKDETGESVPGTALRYGIAAGLLDSLPELGVAKKLTSGAPRESIARAVGKQALSEAATEGTQSYIENKAVESVDRSKDALSSEGIGDILNSAVLGGIGGGVFGGAGELASRMGGQQREHTVDPIAQQTAQRTQDIANLAEQAATNRNAGPLTKAVGLNPTSAAVAGSPLLNNQVEQTDGRAPSMAKEFEAFQKQQREDEKARARITHGIDDLTTAIRAQRLLDEAAAITARPALAAPLDEPRVPRQDIQVGSDGGARRISAEEQFRIDQTRDERDATFSGRAKGFKAPATEIRNPQTGKPWNNYLAASAYRKKLEDGDQFGVKRLDKGRFILARKLPSNTVAVDTTFTSPELAVVATRPSSSAPTMIGEIASVKKQGAEGVPATDGGRSDHAPRGVADHPVSGVAGAERAADAGVERRIESTVSLGARKPERLDSLTNLGTSSYVESTSNDAPVARDVQDATPAAPNAIDGSSDAETAAERAEWWHSLDQAERLNALTTVGSGRNNDIQWDRLAPHVQNTLWATRPKAPTTTSIETQSNAPDQTHQRQEAVPTEQAEGRSVALHPEARAESGEPILAPQERKAIRQEEAPAGSRGERAGDRAALRPAAPAPELVTHVTGKGKTIRGVVRKDLSYQQAKTIDPYTFRKDGGMFIREQHLEKLNAAHLAPATAPATPDQQLAELRTRREKAELGSPPSRDIESDIARIEREQQQTATSRAATAPAGDREIGTNVDGERIFEDSNGVRYVTSNGVGAQAPVEMVPTRNERGGIMYQTRPDNSGARFQPAQQSEQPAVAPAAATAPKHDAYPSQGASEADLKRNQDLDDAAPHKALRDSTAERAAASAEVVAETPTALTKQPEQQAEQPAQQQTVRERPITLYRGTESTGDPNARLRTAGDGEIGPALYATPDRKLAATYGGGPKAKEGAGRTVHTLTLAELPANQYGYVEGGLRYGENARLVDHTGKTLLEYEPTNTSGRAARARIPEIAKNAGIRVIVGMPDSAAMNQVAIMDRSLVQPEQPTAPPAEKPVVEVATPAPQADNLTQEATVNVPNGQSPARDDRAGDAGESPENVRAAPEERRADGRGRAAHRGGEGSVSGSARRGAEGRRAQPTEEVADGSDRGTDDAAARSGRIGAGSGDRVPERKRDGLNYSAAPGTLKREGSWRTTAARNLDIVELVKKLEAEGRQATAEEQAQLAKFTGWGASEIAQNLFPQHDYWAKPEWKELVERRGKLMSADEKAAAARTTQYAHYTSEDVIRGIWSALEGMGFTGGNIVEPGMGIGLFPAAAPESIMEHSRYTGIEYDPFTAKIAKQLLQRENIVEGDYTKTKLPKDFFDVAIGNPPFGKVAIVNDPEYAKQRFPLHDYFFAKTIDRVRPGGLVVFVTSRYTMDKASNRARRHLADRADLLGAIRLPQTAFKENAGTEVVTDILFLRKRMPGEAAAGEAWLSAAPVDMGAGADNPTVNEYFVAHPEFVLGKPELAGSMYRANEYTVLPPDQPIEQALAAAIEKLPKGIYSPKTDAKAMVQATIERDFNPKSKKEGMLYVSDAGHLMRVESGTGVSLLSQVDKPLSAKEAAWMKDYVGLRDAVKQAQYDQLTDGDWEKSLKALNKTYESFVKKHGNIREFTKIEREETDPETNETKSIIFYRWKNAKLLFLDVESPIVEMLESITEDDKIVKSNFLKDRTIKKPARPEINTVKDALMVSLDERGRLDLNFIAQLAGKKRNAVIDELGDLIYEIPAGAWQMTDEYLSGDVVTKLEEAQAAAAVDSRFERNVQALIKVQPKPLGAKDITVQLGAAWVPVDVYEKFASEVLGANVRIQHVPASNTWKIEGAGTRAARQQLSDYGTPDRSAIEILEAALLGKDLKVTRTTKEDGKTKTYTDHDATTAANEKLKAMKEAFNRWMWQDAQRGERVAGLYNRQFNNLAPRKFDGSHLTLPGLSLKYKLYDHQKRAIWRVVQTGNTYLAHAVGAGKTLEMIVGGMEMKRLGLIAKPMYSVPKHMLKQFAAEFLDAYPTANILVADDKNFDKANRGRFVAQAALNNPDAIVITHPAFTKLSVKDDTRKRVADRFIGDLEAAIEEESDKFRRKEMEAQLERLERRFEAKAGKGGKDEVIDFEDLGVDFLFVDEAHEFRKLDFISRRGNIKGIDPNGSARALDLFIKIQHLESQRPGRSVVLASGTPIVNTIAELYSIMRLMAMDQIEADGLDHFDVWANQFGDVRRELEQNAAGQYEFVERFAQFVNVPELMKRVRCFMDVLTSSQLGALVKRPDLEGGQPDLIINPASDRLKTYLSGELAVRIKRSREWKPSFQEPHNPDPLIAIISDGRLAAIDMRFVDPTLKDDPESKLNCMLHEIVDKHKAINDRTYTDKDSGKADLIRGGTQIVFSAVGFGEQVAKSRGFDVKVEIIKKLTAGGIRRDQIAFMDDFASDAKKAQLFKDMRSGKVRVVFGSPKNMGTGVNVQKRLSYLHFLSPPWYPADVEQPHGRILRQGNQNPMAGIKWYATKGTYDSTMWQMVARKQKFIEQAFTGDDSVRKLEDVSESSQYEMASALSSGDQRAIQLAGLNADIERLTRLRHAHADEQRTFRERKSSAEYTLRHTRDAIKRYAKAVEDTGGYVSEMKAVAGGRTLTDRIEIGEFVCSAMARSLNEWTIEDGTTTATSANRTAPSFEIAKIQGKYPLVVDGEALPSFGKKEGLTKSVSLTLVLPESIEQQIETNQLNPGSLDPGGLYTRIRNRLNSLSQTLDEARQKELELKDDIAKLSGRIGVPFQFETDLFEKEKEAANLKAALAAEGKQSPKLTEQPVSGEEPEQPELDVAGDAEAAGRAVVLQLRKALNAKFGHRDIQNLINRGLLRIVPTFGDLPWELRQRVKRTGNAKHGIRGAHDPKSGKVYLIADQIEPARVATMLLHEIGEHYGLERMLGARQYARLQRAVAAMRRTNPVIREAWSTTLRRYPALKEGSVNFIREVIARLADDSSVVDQPWWKDVLQAIRRFLWRLGLRKNITEDDIRGMLLASLRRTMNERGAPQGRARSVTVSADFGDQTETPAFRKWFGDSKVVGADGKPLMVYHGTLSQDIRTFEHGVDGAGWFAADPEVADIFAQTSPTARDSTVYPVYLSIQNPLDARTEEGNAELQRLVDWDSEESTADQLARHGYDGLISEEFPGKTTYLAFRPTQIKSASGNRGSFDANDPDILFDLAGPDAGPTIASARQRIGDYLDTRRTFNRWWHETVGTQYHKAQIDEDFGRVFNRTQEYLTDVSRCALGAADEAQEILPRFESLKDLAKSGASPRELKPVANAIFRGTIEDEKVYTDAELREQYKLNPKQIRLYRQARAAINKSLEDMAITEMVKLARPDISESVARQAAAAGSMQAARDVLAQSVSPEIVNQLDQKIGRVRQLIVQGYAPLMRFGQYSLHVTNKDGESLFFGMYETAAERNRVERLMREQYPNERIRSGIVNDETYQMFRGLTPETIELFASVSGMDQDEAFQQYLRLSKNNRAALKRLIHRKSIEGYNPDLKRVLAQFITSNARAASSNLHMGEMTKAWEAIPKEKGDVQKQAGRLIQYIQNPREEAQAMRSFLFFNFLGGSVASAMVNMTQPLTMSFPYLAQWGATRSGKELAAGMKVAMQDPQRISDPTLRAAMQRAIKEGMVEPHQIHELTAASMRSEGNWGKFDKAREAVTKGLFVWGRMFSLAEQFNRRATFAAAFQVGRKLPAVELATTGVADPYEFAVKAVNETQGIYNRGNRPNWARGAVGAMAFTFKQYSISYLEFLKRLPRKERALAVTVLFLASGVNGLPGMDDLDDLIDTLVQSLGYSTSTKELRKNALGATVTPILGQDATDFIQNGASEFLPIDVQGRLGMQNLIPGTGIGLKSTRDKGAEIAEAIGPAARLAQNYSGAAARFLSGDAAGAVRGLLPNAMQSMMQAANMAQMGFYRDQSGKRVIDTTAVDAFFKFTGFQPSRVAEASRQYDRDTQQVNLAREVESEIADEWAQGLFERDHEKVREARERLVQWNRDNPQSPIRITPNQIRQRVQQMQMTRAERLFKSAPRELRSQLASRMSA